MQDLIEDHTRVPELPTLEDGITLLETGDDRGIAPVQSLAIDSVLLEGGSAVWVDTGHHAVTTHLSEVAPHRRVLDRVHVARGFTPFQHTSLIQGLDCAVTDDTAVVIIPEIDFHYRSEEVRGVDAETMLTRALASVARVAREHDVAVLVTRETADEFSAPVEAAAHQILEYRATPMGPRFVGEEFETLVYELENGWVQTTFAFWRDILKAREPVYNGARAKREVAAGGAY